MSKNENHITLILLGVIIIFLIIIISNRLCNKKNNNVETFKDNETENNETQNYGVKLLNLYNEIQNKIDTYNNDTNKIDSAISELKNLVDKFITEVSSIDTFTDFTNYKNLLNTVIIIDNNINDNNFINLKEAMIEYIDKKEKQLNNETSKNNQDTLDKAIKDIISNINSVPSIQS